MYTKKLYFWEKTKETANNFIIGCVLGALVSICLHLIFKTNSSTHVITTLAIALIMPIRVVFSSSYQKWLKKNLALLNKTVDLYENILPLKIEYDLLLQKLKPYVTKRNAHEMFSIKGLSENLLIRSDIPQEEISRCKIFLHEYERLFGDITPPTLVDTNALQQAYIDMHIANYNLNHAIIQYILLKELSEITRIAKKMKQKLKLFQRSYQNYDRLILQ